MGIGAKARWDAGADGLVPSWRTGSIANHLATAASSVPTQVAIKFDGREITYAELDEMANRAANGILATGSRPGDVVALRAHNAPETLAVFYGLARAGITILPINPRLTREEVIWQMADVEATKLIDDDGLGDLRSIEVIAGAGSTPCDVDVDRDAYLTVRFTSGTTGRPKAVAMTHDSTAYMFEALALELSLQPSDVTLVTAPIAHAAIAMAASTIVTRGTIVLEKGFDPALVWRTCDQHGVTFVFMVPTMFALSLDKPGDGSSIRTLLSMASIFTPTLMGRVKARFPNARLLDAYAGTELGTATLLRYDDHPKKSASVGRPAFGCRVRILDGAGTELPRGEIGTIYVQGRPLAAAFVGSQSPEPGTTRDGFLTVGDLGYMDTDGFLFLVDRRTDLIVTGGFNVYPSEVENVLQSHEGVETVAVIGLPDDTWGSIVTAVVQGTAPQEELEALCRERLANYKAPRRFEYVDALPVNPSGKVLKRELRDRYHST